jgi:two-component sensor histidine kinase
MRRIFLAVIRAAWCSMLRPSGYDKGTADKIELTGPSIRLVPNAAPTLSMATHELATDAAKYGALSSLNGRLRVKWDVEATRGDGLVFGSNF